MASRTYVQRSSSSSSNFSPSLGGGAYRGVTFAQMSPSVYGGAGGFGTRVSSTSYAPLQGSSSFQYSSNDGVVLSGNEKVTMQNLNDRLASYLERVRSLEGANSQLEVKIKDHYGKTSPATGRDFSKYYQTIQDLQGQIQNATQDNGRLLLQVDNAKLAADDFRLKFETELALRQNVEGDIAGLRRLLDDLTMKKADLELQIEQLQEELAYLKKNHGAEVAELSQQLGGSVNVEVDAAPAVDLGKMMAEMRAQYDKLAEKHRQDAKDHFDRESQTLVEVVTGSSKELTDKQNDIIEVRRKVQGLEIELQAQLSTKAALENTVAETEARYGSQVAIIQEQIRMLEGQLAKIRADMEHNRNDYSALMNIKIRLEMEIAEYRRLLEGEEPDSEKEKLRLEEVAKEQDKKRKIKTIVEEVVDGKVVSSKTQEVVEKI